MGKNWDNVTSEMSQDPTLNANPIGNASRYGIKLLGAALGDLWDGLTGKSSGNGSDDPGDSNDQREESRQGGPQDADVDMPVQIDNDQKATTSGRTSSSSSGRSQASDGALSEVVNVSNTATQSNTLEQTSTSSFDASNVVEIQSNASQQFQGSQQLDAANVQITPVISIDASDTYAPALTSTDGGVWSLVIVAVVGMVVVMKAMTAPSGKKSTERRKKRRVDAYDTEFS